MGLLWPVTPASLGTKGVCDILISDSRGSKCSFLRGVHLMYVHVCVVRIIMCLCACIVRIIMCLCACIVHVIMSLCVCIVRMLYNLCV